MVYVCEDMTLSGWSEATLEKLPAGRRARALRYRQQDDRMLSAAAYLLLRYALQKEYGFTLFEDTAYTANGKPYLLSRPEIQFSISHCKEAVAVAVADKPIGIDVESIGPYDTDVAAYCCNDDELRAIASATDKATAFTTLWTQKESMLKRNGDAAPESIKDMLNDAEGYFQTLTTERYVCTICSTDNVVMRVKQVGSNELLLL